MTTIRSVFVLAAGSVFTLVLGGWLILSSLLRLPWARRHCEPTARLWARLCLRVSGVRVTVEGAETLDRNHPYVVVANHQSWFDVFAITGHLPLPFRFVGKEELASIPIFGRAWTGCGHISLDRDDRSRAIDSLRDAGREVREKNLAVILFPEGTRSPDGALRSFKKGAFVLGIQTGVPILPVGISGSRHVMPKGSFRIRPGHIRVRIGKPIPVEGLTMRDRNDLLERGRAAVLELMDDPDGTVDPALPGTDDTGAALPEPGHGASTPPADDHEPGNSTDPEHEETRR